MGTILWFTGLSGSGKSTIAEALERELNALGKTVCILDADVVRSTLHRHLGFSLEDIKENNRLIALLSKDKADMHDFVLVPIISPFADSRRNAREISSETFLEIYVESSYDTRTKRDPKDLYGKARRGEISPLIGLAGGVHYEIPENPDITINTDNASVELSIHKMMEYLKLRKLI